ncbi:MAG: tetratricopeptide repeat protein [Deltaproteobacteria bacterium]|nr:tetratricopeptide repeat protein [Deltaproteobacteria bacterium]
MTECLQLSAPSPVHIPMPDIITVRGFLTPDSTGSECGNATALSRRWPWRSRELSAPPGFPRRDDSLPELEAEGDFGWLDSDMDGFERIVLAGNSLDSAIYLSRIARLHLLAGGYRAAEAAGSAAYPHLSSGQGHCSEEALFCEETLALAGFRSWGWTRTNEALADIALRSGRHLGPLSPQTLRAVASRAALASRIGVRPLAGELYAELVHRDISALGSSHRFTLADRICLASEACLAGDRVFALGIARACVAEAESVLGEFHPLRCMAMFCEGEILAAGGTFAEATSALSAAAELHLKVFGPDHERTLDCAGALAGSLYRSGHPDLAEKVLRKAVDDLECRMDTCTREAEEAWERLLLMQEEMGFTCIPGTPFRDSFA